MKYQTTSLEQGNVLICALCTILIISLIGANVLQNCTTRFNVASSQVRSWKEALFAAEAGGEIGYAEIRKTERF
jgi:Tfp pilus assembly protein PilX